MALTPYKLRLDLFAAGGLLASIAAAYWFGFFGGSEGPSPENHVARLAEYDADRADELLELTGIDHPEAVRAAAVQRLGELQHLESAERLVELLEDESPQVRGRAGVALQRIVGADFGYRATVPASQQRESIAAIQQLIGQWQKQPPAQYQR